MELIQTKPKTSSWFYGSYLAYFLMYNFYYLSWALFSAFISVYMMDLGYTAAQVSLVVSSSFFASMALGPLAGRLCDKKGSKLVNFVLFGLCLPGGLFFMHAQSLWMLAIGYSFVLMLINAANPIMEKIASSAPYSYGKIRIWGTIGYALGSQMAGLLYDWISPKAIFFLFLVTMGLCILGLMGTMEDAPAADASKEDNSLKDGKNSSMQTLMKNKTFWLYTGAAVLFTGIFNAVNTYMPAILTHEGLSISVSSVIMSVAVLFEVPLVLFSGKFMDRLAVKKLMLICFMMGSLLLIVLAFQVWMPLKLFVILLCKHPASMLFIMVNIKAVSSITDSGCVVTALAIVQTLRSLSSVLFQNLSGSLIDSFGYEPMAMILLAVLDIGLAYTLILKLPKGCDQKLFS